METNAMEQMEALRTLAGYNNRLLQNIPTLNSELRGNRKPDTDVYLKNIIDVIGWEISVINATSSLLAQARTHMDKELFNQSVLTLNGALSSGSDAAVADALQSLIPHLQMLKTAAEEVLA